MSKYAETNNKNEKIVFHIGDFVQNREGTIGYISDICKCSECAKRGFFEPKITYLDGREDYISFYMKDHLKDFFMRIGGSVFTNYTHLTEKGKLLLYLNNPKPTNIHNSKRYPENWYDSYFAMMKTFSKDEILHMSDSEIEHLLKLADNIQENLY